MICQIAYLRVCLKKYSAFHSANGNERAKVKNNLKFYFFTLDNIKNVISHDFPNLVGHLYMFLLIFSPFLDK